MKLSVFCIAIFISISAFGHTRWTLDGATPPRNASSGLKTGPCGNVAQTSTPTALEAGSTIELQWEETINHPGYYRIAFSLDSETSFDDMVLLDNIEDTQGIETPLPHLFSAMVTLPNIECENCTLQLIQYMTENPENPRLYYSCADINLVQQVVINPPDDPESEPETSLTEQVADDFLQIDSNSDNEITFDELMQSIPMLDSEQFNSIDVNLNGVISRSEVGLDALTPIPEVDDENEVSSGGLGLIGLFLLCCCGIGQRQMYRRFQL